MTDKIMFGGVFLNRRKKEDGSTRSHLSESTHDFSVFLI